MSDYPEPIEIKMENGCFLFFPSYDDINAILNSHKSKSDTLYGFPLIVESAASSLGPPKGNRKARRTELARRRKFQ